MHIRGKYKDFVHGCFLYRFINICRHSSEVFLSVRQSVSKIFYFAKRLAYIRAKTLHNMSRTLTQFVSFCLSELVMSLVIVILI